MLKHRETKCHIRIAELLRVCSKDLRAKGGATARGESAQCVLELAIEHAEVATHIAVLHRSPLLEAEALYQNALVGIDRCSYSVAKALIAKSMAILGASNFLGISRDEADQLFENLKSASSIVASKMDTHEKDLAQMRRHLTNGAEEEGHLTKVFCSLAGSTTGFLNKDGFTQFLHQVDDMTEPKVSFAMRKSHMP